MALSLVLGQACVCSSPPDGERGHQLTSILLISWPVSHPHPAMMLHGLSAMLTWNEAIPEVGVTGSTH